MQDLDDLALLREYAANNSEAAYAELVARRIGFVYSAALRQVRDRHLAGEITQAVFIILAQKAGKISDKTILAGWLFKTTRYVAIAQTREIVKRSLRTAILEKEFQMQTELQSAATDPLWEQMSPLLDEALAALGETDRQAVLLRFFENKSLAEVGNFLGIGEDTARKRISRALEKLHRHFNRRGISSTTAIIAGAISANSVQAAPVGLAKTISAVAVAKGAAASASTLILTKTTLNLMAWIKTKIVLTSAGILLAAATATIAINWELNSKALDENPPTVILRPTQFQSMTGGATSGSKIVLKNVSLRLLLGMAYGHNEFRMVFPDDYPKGNFDFMFTRSGIFPDELKVEIKKQFGLVAHREIRHANVLLAEIINPDASGLKITSSNENQQIGNFRDVVFKGAQIDTLTSWLEAITETPVIDETGLTNHYDITVKWKPKTGQTEADAICQILPNQFGIELVPTNMPIEMLVVEKAK